MTDLARERAIELEDENAALRSPLVTLLAGKDTEIASLRQRLEERTHERNYQAKLAEVISNRVAVLEAENEGKSKMRALSSLPFMMLITVLYLMLMGTIGIVAYHFIAKFW